MSDPLHRQMFPLTFQEHGAAIRRPPAVPRRHGSGLRSRWHARLKEEIHESHPPYRPRRERRRSRRRGPRRLLLGRFRHRRGLRLRRPGDHRLRRRRPRGRQANEDNIQETFTEDAGFTLKYAPATNLDQKSQIDAFSSFVDEGVDLILLSATEGSGWEESLGRAQEAEIPVILIDRGIEPD